MQSLNQLLIINAKHYKVEVYPPDMKRDLNKYNLARIMRLQGDSIRTISKSLRISSSSASIWCRDLELSEEQKIRLAQKGKSAELLRSFGKKRKEAKLENNREIFEQARESVKEIDKVSLFLTGLALYWAEGFKSQKEQRVGFCNSDPRMIKFIIRWFSNSLSIPLEDFTLRAEFNIDHQGRGEEIEDYWSNLTGIPRSQFNKPYLQKAKLLRDYPDKNNYYGVLRIRVRRSSQLLVKLRGWIEGLSSWVPSL